jgi:hypothetical protein
MKRYGGSFAERLAYAMEAADPTNLKALFDSNDIYHCAIEKHLDGGIFDNE